MIINLQHIKEIRTESDGDYSVVLTDGEKLTVSRSYRPKIMELLTNG